MSSSRLEELTKIRWCAAKSSPPGKSYNRVSDVRLDREPMKNITDGGSNMIIPGKTKDEALVSNYDSTGETIKAICPPLLVYLISSSPKSRERRRATL